jgi:hypothetical protein
MNIEGTEGSEVTVSRFLGILSLVASLATTGAVVLQVIRPDWAVYALAFSAAISAFTSRVQGHA